MRIGVVLLPQDPWAQARERWQRAESFGFDHAWTYDHLAWRTLVDEPWYATVPLLTAAAVVTERIGLGTWVASPNYRHPVPFAKDVMGLDDISGGRLLLGLGAGGTGVDARVLGPALTPRARTSRFEEFVAVLDALLTQRVTDHAGQTYEVNDARMIPGCVQQPRVPFVVAANGPRALRVAARYGQGWATFGPVLDPQPGDAFRRDDGAPSDDGGAPASGGGTPERSRAAAQEQWWAGLAELVSRFEDAADEAGRDPGEVDRYLSLDGAPVYSLESVDVLVEGVERAAGLGFTDVVVHWPRAQGVYAGRESVLEEAASRLGALREL